MTPDTHLFKKWFKNRGNGQNTKVIYIYMGRIKQYVYIDPMTWDSNGKADDKKEGKESTSLETKDNEEHYKTVYIYHGICKTMAFLSIIWV